jgi:hypothetical protein
MFFNGFFVVIWGLRRTCNDFARGTVHFAHELSVESNHVWLKLLKNVVHLQTSSSLSLL